MFLFFFMEETNYHRKIPPIIDVEPNTIASPPIRKSEVGAEPDTGRSSEKITNVEHKTYKNKTYLDKLKIFNRQELQYPNQTKGMVLRSLIFLRVFFLISYAGFSYGSNLFWINVLNGTAFLVFPKSHMNSPFLL